MFSTASIGFRSLRSKEQLSEHSLSVMVENGGKIRIR